MLEVIIAILTITAFLTGTLQLMAVDALYRVRAERQAQANFWIQDDFENTKYIASGLDVKSDPKFVSPDVCTNTSEGYATALRRLLTETPLSTTTIPTKQLVVVETPKKEDFKNFLGKNYSLYRTFNIADQSANPHRLLIEYEVRLADPKTANDYPNQENVIAKSSVEVIPDASFKCP